MWLTCGLLPACLQHQQYHVMQAKHLRMVLRARSHRVWVLKDAPPRDTETMAQMLDGAFRQGKAVRLFATVRVQNSRTFFGEFVRVWRATPLLLPVMAASLIMCLCEGLPPAWQACPLLLAPAWSQLPGAATCHNVPPAAWTGWFIDMRSRHLDGLHRLDAAILLAGHTCAHGPDACTAVLHRLHADDGAGQVPSTKKQSSCSSGSSGSKHLVRAQPRGACALCVRKGSGARSGGTPTPAAAATTVSAVPDCMTDCHAPGGSHVQLQACLGLQLTDDVPAACRAVGMSGDGVIRLCAVAML